MTNYYPTNIGHIQTNNILFQGWAIILAKGPHWVLDIDRRAGPGVNSQLLDGGWCR